MSQTYTYDVGSATATGKINPGIFEQSIVDSSIDVGANPIEAITTTGGGGPVAGVITGGTLHVTFQDALSTNDQTVLNGLVAAEQGVAFGPATVRIAAEGETSDNSDTPVTKLSATLGPMIPGTYLVTAYCEIKTAAVVAGSSVRASINFGGSEGAQDNWTLDEWHAFSATCVVSVDAGTQPVMELTFQRVGVDQQVQIRRARLTIHPVIG